MVIIFVAPQHLYQLEVSLLFGNITTAATLVAHIPLVRKKQGMKLLSFKKFPIKDPEHDYQILINPSNQYLALTPDNEYFCEFTSAELQLCNRVLLLTYLFNDYLTHS